MKTNNPWLFAAILFICSAFTFTACSDDDSAPNGNDIYTLTIEQAEKEAYLVTQKSLQDANVYTSPFTHWTKGEKVEVLIDNGKDEINRTCIGTLIAQESGTSVTLKGTVDLKGYDIDSLLSLKKGFDFLLVTSPTIDYTQQDGTYSTITQQLANVLGSIGITGVNKEKKELLNEGTDVFWNCGGLMSYTLRDTNGQPLKAERLIISCIDDFGELFTRYEDITTAQFKQGPIDIKLTIPSDVIYVWEEVPMEGYSDGNKPVRVTAIVKGEIYTASYKVFHIMDEENYHRELVMEKQ